MTVNPSDSISEISNCPSTAPPIVGNTTQASLRISVSVSELALASSCCVVAQKRLLVLVANPKPWATCPPATASVALVALLHQNRIANGVKAVVILRVALRVVGEANVPVCVESAI